MIGHMVDTERRNAQLMRERLRRRRTQMQSNLSVIALAIEATLDLLWLREHAEERRHRPKLGLCYSAFGDVSGIAREYAQELTDLFSDNAKLHVFAVEGMGGSAEVPPKIHSVHIHHRTVYPAELAAFPGMKAPGLIGACVDAVNEAVDLIVTIDGDGRLPLFEIAPDIRAMLETDVIDAALGSRRVPGALVAKPGLRHLTSMVNACYVDVLMRPVVGRIQDLVRKMTIPACITLIRKFLTPG